MIETAIGDALDGFHAEEEALLLRRFDEITLADLAGDLQERLAIPASVLPHAHVPTG